jgi:hypothetical protein
LNTYKRGSYGKATLQKRKSLVHVPASRIAWSNLPFSRLPDTRRALEIHCGNCGARFIAFYETEEYAATQIVDAEKCGLCGADLFKKDNFKAAVIRLVAEVTAPGVKRD